MHHANQYSTLPKPKPKRLGEPLGTTICAHCGGNAWSLLLEIQELRRRRVACEIGISFLDKSETPPAGSVYLRDVNVGFNAPKFSARPRAENGMTVIDIPSIEAVVKRKRIRVNAGTILAVVDRGNAWRDRSGYIHENPM